jgi:Recombination endonuclease VII
MYKKCRICGTSKPVTDFYAAAGMADGFRSECKACNLAQRGHRYQQSAEFRAREIARVRAWQQANRERLNETRGRIRARPGFAERMRAGHLKRKYGITLDDYQAMLAAQGGGCAICSAAPPDGQPLHVDHDHDTGLVRGLLCFTCNAGIGMFDHNIDLLSAAVVYLRR